MLRAVIGEGLSPLASAWVNRAPAPARHFDSGRPPDRLPAGLAPQRLLPAEVQGLLRAAGQSVWRLARRNYAVVQLLLQAGLRVSEAAALRIEDLEIRERQGKVRIRGKGNKERYVPLNATARRALQTYLDEREETGTQDPVFLSDTGALLSVRSIQSLISGTGPAVSAHTLKHTV